MAKLVTTESLKDSLKKFKVKADSYWALKDEVPTDEEIGTIVESIVSELEIEADSLTSADVADILATI